MIGKRCPSRLVRLVVLLAMAETALMLAFPKLGSALLTGVSVGVAAVSVTGWAESARQMNAVGRRSDRGRRPPVRRRRPYRRT